MATGMEMMVAAIMKASGIDTDKLKDDITAYGQKLAEKIASMDAALAALSKSQTAMLESIEGIRAGQTILSDLIVDIARGARGNASAPPVNGEESPHVTT